MRWYWKNNGEPDENGDLEIVMENDEGNRISNFKGKSKDEIITGLANSQVHANRRLGELLKPDKAQPPTDTVSEADRVRLSSGVTDPSRVVETVGEIVTKKQKTDKEMEAYYLAEAQAFMAAYPEYYPIVANQTVLIDMLKAKQYDITRNNLAIVYQQAINEGTLEPWPSADGGDGGDGGDEEDEQEAARPRGRDGGSTAVAELPRKPVSRASGLRNSDASASRPAPLKKKPTVTWAELEKMSRQEYSDRLRDPEFRRAVDALGSKA